MPDTRMPAPGSLGELAAPVRVQLRRTKGWCIPENTVKVDRTTKWGNPFIPGQPLLFLGGRKVQDKRHAASLYLGFAPEQPRLVEAARAELRGKNLACWCGLCDLHKAGRPLGSNCPYCERCHADTLLQIANGAEAARMVREFAALTPPPPTESERTDG